MVGLDRHPASTPGHVHDSNPAIRLPSELPLEAVDPVAHFHLDHGHVPAFVAHRQMSAHPPTCVRLIDSSFGSPANGGPLEGIVLKVEESAFARVERRRIRVNAWTLGELHHLALG